MILFKDEKLLDRLGQVYTLQFPNNGDNNVVSNFHFIPPLVPPFEPKYLDYDADCLDEIREHIGLTNKWLVDMYLKGTYGGLILLQGVLLNSHLNLDECSPRSDDQYYHYVCNPVTKKWKELPLILTSDLVGFTCYHLKLGDRRICVDVALYDDIIKHNIHFGANKVEFTVISIHGDVKDAVFKIQIFSSSNEKAGWSTFYAPFPRGFKWISESCKLRVLFFNGKFHWCSDNCIAAYDPFNRPEECDIIPFPSVGNLFFSGHVLGAPNEHLRLVSSVLENRNFLVWELLDYAKQVWVKKYNVDYAKRVYFGKNVGLTLKRDLVFKSFAGGAGVNNDKVYVLDMPTSIMIL